MSDEERGINPSEGEPAQGGPQPPAAEQPYVEGPRETEPMGAQAFGTQASLPPVQPGPQVTGPVGVSDDDRVMAGLAWLSMVLLQIPLISVVILLVDSNKNRPFQRYHAINSLLFWAAALVYEILAGILFTVLTAISLGILACCLWIIFFLPHLVAIFYAYQAYQKQEFEIPLITELARSQHWI